MEDAQALAIVVVVLAMGLVQGIAIPLAILRATLLVQEHAIRRLVVLHACQSQGILSVQQTCIPSMEYVQVDVLPSVLGIVPRVVFQNVQGLVMLMVN